MKSLPNVWAYPPKDMIMQSIGLHAKKQFALHSLLPSDPHFWAKQKEDGLQKLKAAIGFHVNHDLPLDVEYTGTIYREGYRVEKLSYQADEDRYVTACLYVPDGEGPFPAVLNVHGHHIAGHLEKAVQKRGLILVQKGFVVLSVDAFGAGERSGTHGEFEYHGGPRGTLLNNMGQTLLGIQIADNMRGVDLLCSLPYVDSGNIGVTGASGGGNQTMYLAAFDERLKAAVSVCSAGSYQSLAVGNNCICECVPGGLDICEESFILACIAPRAYAMLNGLYDTTSKNTFTPDEMFHSYQTARAVFKGMDAENQLQYQIYPTGHGYHEDALSYMLGFFELHLKGKGLGQPAKLPSLEYLTQEEAMVYPKGKRPSKVKGIIEYCAIQGKKLKQQASTLTAEEKKQGYEKVLHSYPAQILHYSAGDTEDGWEKYVLQKEDGLPIPVLLRPSQSGKWRVMSAVYGKSQLKECPYLDEAIASGDGLLLFDLFGSGELGDEYGCPTLWDYHDIARSSFWVGKPMLGQWVRDYTAVITWLKDNFCVESLTAYGYKDAGIAAFLSAVLYGSTDHVISEGSLKSLNWSDGNPGINDFTLGLCVTNILKYGDLEDLAETAPNLKTEWIHPIRGDGSPL